MKRRSVLAGSALGAGLGAGLGVGARFAASLAPLGLISACSKSDRATTYDGGWVGADHARGHLLRDGAAAKPTGDAVARRASVLIVGAGIAGLACARALRRRGIDEVHVLELEDSAGGNSRGHQIAGMACPLGAHYLPLPDESNTALVELLTEFGLCKQEGGRTVYDERHLCHSPQERLFIDPARHTGTAGGPHDEQDAAPEVHWHEGLLPPVDALPQAERAATRADYRRFADLVAEQVRSRAFAIPTARAAWSEALAALDAISFATWLDKQGLHSTALRWYLDYCCRDDYGGGAAQVSAWAGLHYFASRHGFHAPGDDAPADEGGILTWPEGNAWLSRRLAQPLGERLHTGRVVMKVDEGRHEVVVDTWDAQAGRRESWTASQVVLATPLFIAARLLARPPAALQAAVGQMRHAPWLVANLHIGDALRDHPGAPPSWDNVIYRSAALGYVDAMHQSTRPYEGATVLTAYWALGGDDGAQALAGRRALLDTPWATWAERVIAELEPAHPDLRRGLQRVDLMRYGHAMSMPVPGVRGNAALQALSQPGGRVHLAHSDLSGYSIFEEAFAHGHRVGSQLRL